MAAALVVGGALGGAIAYGSGWGGSWMDTSLMVVGGVLAAILGAAGAFDEPGWWK